MPHEHDDDLHDDDMHRRHVHDTHHGHGHDGTDADLADLLDLDGEVLHAYWTEALNWVQSAVAVTGCERILDLGAGSGIGTIAWAQRMAGAEVIAVDSSEDMLRRIQRKALDLGLAERIRTVHADLDDAWPDFDAVDVTWLSKSLHHMTDPDRVLRDVYAATRPDGLVAVVEFDEPLRFLPDDIGFGRPGLEVRCLDALSQERAHSLPNLGSAWSPRIAAAGFTDVDERVFIIELNPPHLPAAIDYARGWLRRLRSATAHRLDPDDQQALEELLGGGGQDSAWFRDQLTIHGTRTVTIGRRL